MTTPPRQTLLTAPAARTVGALPLARLIVAGRGGGNDARPVALDADGCRRGVVPGARDSPFCRGWRQ